MKRKSEELRANVSAHISECEQENNCGGCIYDKEVINGPTTIDGEFVLADNETEVSQFIDNGDITTSSTADIHVHRWLDADKYSVISSPLTLAERDVFNNRYGVNPNFYKYEETNDDGLLDNIENNWMDAWKFGDKILEDLRGQLTVEIKKK